MRPRESNSDLFVHSSGISRVPKEAQPIIYSKAAQQEAPAEHQPMADAQLWHRHAGRNDIHTRALLPAGQVNGLDGAGFSEPR